MKYLIQNKKEFAITVAAFIMAVINLIRSIMNHEVTEDLIITVVLTAVGILAWYYNMPTSEENSRHTGLMRLEKKMKKEGYVGEDFSDILEEDKEDD